VNYHVPKQQQNGTSVAKAEGAAESGILKEDQELRTDSAPPPPPSVIITTRCESIDLIDKLESVAASQQVVPIAPTINQLPSRCCFKERDEEQYDTVADQAASGQSCSHGSHHHQHGHRHHHSNSNASLEQLMQKCWPQETGDRPNFRSLKETIHKLHE